MVGRAATALFLAVLASAPAAAARFSYDFSTDEPFAGGEVRFTFEADSPPPFDTFIQAGALSSYSPGVARIRFGDACFAFVPGASSSVACDRVEVIVNTANGTTSLFRLFQDGALVTPGSYGTLTGTAARLVVAPAGAAAVPEPASWAVLIGGFGLVGGVVRRRVRFEAAAA